MSTNEKVINGVRYRLSKSDYDAISDYTKKINEILARATVVENDKVATPVTTPAPTKPVEKLVATPSPAKPAATPVEKEQLTDASMKRVLGKYYGQVCAYNCETESLMSKIYNGEYLHWDCLDTRHAQGLKKAFEKEFPRFELVAVVSGQTKREWLRFGIWKMNIRFVDDGDAIVTNMIIRDKHTGKLELFNANAWFGVTYWATPEMTAQRCAYGLVSYYARMSLHMVDFWAGRSR